MQSLRLFYNHFYAWRRVTFHGEHPKMTSLKTTFMYLRSIGAFPSKPSEEAYSYTIANAILMLSLISFVFTITCDLYEASGDFLTFGDDVCVLVGLYLILFKIILYRIYKSNIECIVAEYESLREKFAHYSAAVRVIQRSNYIEEIVIFYIFAMLGNVLFAVVGFQPILSGLSRTLPFRAKFPFSVDDRAVFIAVYIFQCVCVLINIKTITYIDNTGCVFINQTSANLRILCQRLRDFSTKGMNRDDLREIVLDHQRIIRLIEYISKYFYLNYVSQIAASTFLICLTAFEAQLAAHQPMVALKFYTYMFASFMQLIYWCWVGNRVRFDILGSSYSYFTLLRTLSD